MYLADILIDIHADILDPCVTQLEFDIACQYIDIDNLTILTTDIVHISRCDSIGI